MASTSSNYCSQFAVLELFKEKVKDALSLLPNIGEGQKQEVWTFWQLVSVAVKIAVGGRGSAVPTKRERLAARRGRPLTRHALHRKSNDVHLAEIGGFLAGSKSLEEDGPNQIDGTYQRKTETEAAGSTLKKTNESEAVVEVSAAVSIAPGENSEDAIAMKAEEADSQMHQLETCQSLRNQSDAKSQTEDSQGSETSDSLPQDIAIKVSQDHDAEESVVASASSKMLSESAVSHARTSKQQMQKTTTDVVSSSPDIVTPASVSLKRKRGRPRKISILSGNKAVFETHTAEVTAAEEKTRETASVQGNKVEQELKPAMTSKRNRSKQDVASTLDGNGMGSHTNTPVSEPGVSQGSPPKTLTQPGASQTSVQRSCVGVRRSERRSAPNRDKLFCYFDKAHAEEETAVEEDTMVVEPVVELQDTTLQELKAPKAKTKEEKLQERTCTYCHVVLCSQSSMAAHMRTHTGDRPFACHICKKGFTTKANCERHEATHLGLKSFTCPLCDKRFTEKKSMKIHMRSHTGERPYQCPFCDMGFFQTGTLKTHMDRHTGHKRHLCDFCGKSFRQRSQLRLHVQRHNKYMPFSCEQCQKTFYTKSDKERHMIRHTGERPYACNLCDKTFTRLQYLREHKNIHTGGRPYKCSKCGMAFPDRAACRRHVQKHNVRSQKIPVQPQHTIEITTLPEGGVIINGSNLPASSSDVQYIVTTETLPHVEELATVTSNDSKSEVKSNQTTSDAIISNIIDVGEGTEIYQLTLVDSASGLQVVDKGVVPQIDAPVEIPGISLLPSATSKGSLPK